MAFQRDQRVLNNTLGINHVQRLESPGRRSLPLLRRPGERKREKTQCELVKLSCHSSTQGGLYARPRRLR